MLAGGGEVGRRVSAAVAAGDDVVGVRSDDGAAGKLDLAEAAVSFDDLGSCSAPCSSAAVTVRVVGARLDSAAAASASHSFGLGGDGKSPGVLRSMMASASEMNTSFTAGGSSKM